MPRIAKPSTLVVIAALVAGICAGCSKPKPIPPDVPPEPQATQLRDAMQAPLDKAKAVEGTIQDADAQRRAELEANGG